MERKLWDHQETARKIAAAKRDFALFFEPGCGKTLTAITIARDKMWQKGHVLKTLVLCPPIVIKNWRGEWLMGSKLQAGQVHCLYGSGSKRAAFFTSNAQKIVLITNYESLLMDNVFSAIKEWGPEIIIFDESHRCKNPSAQRTKKAALLSRLAKHRMILTGTPVLNTPMDLFSQFLLLDDGETFGTNFFSFRAKYFYDKNANMPSHIKFPDWRIRPNSLEEITKKISEKSMHVKKENCLDLPPLVKKQVMVSMSKEQEKAYIEMTKEFITYVNGSACVARLALTKALRLMQIVSGFIALEGENGEDRTQAEFKDSPREKVLSELLEDLTLSGKVLVWASFRHNYEQIRNVCKKLDLPYVEIHGDISANKKMENVVSFNEDPKIKVCIGHPGSGGIGVNLVSAKYAIFYSRTFSLEHDIQAEARNHRGGSEVHDKITRYDLIAENTIDELIAKRLEAKQAISESIVKDLAVELKNAISCRDE